VIDAAITHLRRAHAFLDEAVGAHRIEDKSRYLASAVESAVGIVEVLLSQVADKNRVYELADRHLPRYRLLKRVRIHEFHRSPLPVFPPELLARTRVQYMQGPVSLSTGTTPYSSASMTLTPSGPKYETTGSGKVDRSPHGGEKEIWISNGEIWDDRTSDWVALDTALGQFLAGTGEFLRAASLLP